MQERKPAVIALLPLHESAVVLVVSRFAPPRGSTCLHVRHSAYCLVTWASHRERETTSSCWYEVLVISMHSVGVSVRNWKWNGVQYQQPVGDGLAQKPRRPRGMSMLAIARYWRGLKVALGQATEKPWHRRYYRTQPTSNACSHRDGLCECWCLPQQTGTRRIYAVYLRQYIFPTHHLHERPKKSNRYMSSWVTQRWRL